MRHLFGTWKGVFPPQCLQMIEKELGFTPSINRSALKATSKPDSLPQRPAHSIHVNPKYVETRQHLQQPSRNMQQPIKNATTDPFLGKNTVHTEYQNGTDISRQPGSGILKTGYRATNQGCESPWYGADCGDKETTFNQRNDFNTKTMLLSSSSPQPANNDAKSHSSHGIMSSLNSSGMESSLSSGEVEYMWDDVKSRSNVQSATCKSKRDPRLTSDSERLDFHTSLLKSQNLPEFESRVDTEASDDFLPLENGSTSIWPRESYAVGGTSYPSSGQMIVGSSKGHYTSTRDPSANTNSLVRKPLPSTNIGYSTNELPGSSGSVNPKLYTPAMATLSGQLPLHQRPPSPSLSILHYGNQGHHRSEKELSLSQTLPHLDARPQIPGQLNLSLYRQFPLNPGIAIENIHSHNSHKLQSPNLQALSSVKPSSEQGHNIPFLQQSQPVHTVSTLLPSHSSVQLSLPSGPQPIQSEAKVASGSDGNSSYKILSVSSILPQGQVEKPPVLNGPPLTPLSRGASEQSKTMVKAIPGPVSSLLGTLMEKGLISASTKDLSASGPPQIISRPESQRQEIVVAPLVTSSFLQVSSTVAPSSSSFEISGSVVAHPVTTSFHEVSPPLAPSFTSEVLSLSNSDAKSCTTVPVSSLEETKDLIGLEFTPKVIRELHPVVINNLLENLSHHCSICGMRMKIIEQFDRHMEWHTVKNLKLNNSNKSSRGWYLGSNAWIDKKVSNHEIEDILDVPGIALGNNTEQMVPTDENQCVCVLCGELFEDIYYPKKDQWMFKGAVYLNLPSNGDMDTSDAASNGPIIHADCITESSTHDLGLTSL
ncbi:hypothetical protein AgCh_005001 [Apium graveolens]